MTTATPIVDRVLIDPMSIPPRVDVWLRGVERDAYLHYERSLTAIGEAEVVTPLLLEIADELKQFLQDTRTSPLYRLLRRPLSQLALDAPAARAFQRHTSSLFERAGEVVMLQELADVLRREILALRAEYQPRLPRATQKALLAARLTEDSILAARRAEDLKVRLKRLQYVRAQLQTLAELVPDGSSQEPAFREGNAPSLGELQAVVAAKLRRRERAARSGFGVDQVREVAQRQMRKLGERAGWRQAATKPQQVVTQAILEQGFTIGSARATPGRDTEVWAAALSAADRASYEAAAPDVWSPQVSAPAATELHVGSTTVFFALHLEDGLVLLSQQIITPVRVWSRSLKVGSTVECRVFGTSSPIEDALAAIDLDPLFDGRGKDPAWYQTARRAVLQIVADNGDQLFARVVRKGTLQRLTASASSADVPAAGALRVLERSQMTDPTRSLAIVALAELPRSFAGVSTQAASAPLEGLDRVLLRTYPRGSSEAPREQDLFRRLRQRGARHALRYICNGHDDSVQGAVYAPPMAFDAAESVAVRRWMDARPMLFIKAAARVAIAAHEAGYAIGIYHPDAFAFGIFRDPTTGCLEPWATLLYGGAAAPLNSQFPAVLGGPLASIRYPRIRFRGVALPFAKSELATPESDAAAFGLFILELLAIKPLNVPGNTLYWKNLETVLANNAEAFHHPELIPAIVQRMQQPELRSDLLAGLHRLASGATDWLRVEE